MKQCEIGAKKVYNLAIWDTAGEDVKTTSPPEKFDSLTNFYCRNARAALVCYDITNRASFTGIQKWVDKVKQEADPNCAMLIVGNKRISTTFLVPIWKEIRRLTEFITFSVDLVEAGESRAVELAEVQ
eukprot:969053-Amorphochlora_amoeboformis.AAC.2